MPAQLGFQDITATKRYAFAPQRIAQADNVAVLGIGAAATTTWTCSGTIQGNPFSAQQDPNNLGWQNLAAMRLDTNAIENTPTLTNNTARQWKVSCDGLQQLAFNVTALTGDMPINFQSQYDPAGVGIVQAVSSSQTIAGTLTVNTANANALAVGANGATNPVLQINTSASTVATGLEVSGAAAGSGVALQAITSGTNEVLTLDAAAAALVKIGTVASTALGLQVGSATSAAGTQLLVVSTNAAALAVGANGATNPALVVNSNTASSKTGLTVTSNAAGSGVALAAISNATNEGLTLDAKGSSPVTIGSVSTGGTYVRNAVVTLAATGTAIGNAAAVVGEGFITVTGSNNSAAVILPQGAVGKTVTLQNTVQTATLQVFPQVNNAINNLANNAVYNIPNGGQRSFTYTAAGQWWAAPQTIT